MMGRLSILLGLLLLPALCPASAGQSRSAAADTARVDSVRAETPGGPAAVFAAVERGLRESDVRHFSPFFSRTLPLNLRGVGAGYYSANQAGEVLRHFLVRHRLGAFSFTTVHEGEEPFATGSAPPAPGGGRLQVYVALTREGAGWVISQFNIY